MLTKDLAICLRVLDYSETSQIVTFFTRANGKISAIAKGSKRAKSAFDGPVEAFSLGKIVFTQTTNEKLATLTEFEQEPPFTHLSTDLFALNCSLFCAELVNCLTNEYDPHSQLFDQFVQFLKNSQDFKGKSSALAMLVLFQLTLLQEIGLQLILKICVNCKNSFNDAWPETYFSSTANGLICRDCEPNFADKIRLTKPAANCLGNLKMIAQADEKTLNEIEKVMVYHFTELLHRPPKMAKYILKN